MSKSDIEFETMDLDDLKSQLEYEKIQSQGYVTSRDDLC
jgi:hypothetical protein